MGGWWSKPQWRSARPRCCSTLILLHLKTGSSPMPTDSADNRTLADRYADAVMERRTLDAKVKAMRAAILDMGAKELRGAYSTVSVTESTQTRLDQNKVRLLLTDDQYASCLVSTPMTFVRVKGADSE